MDRRSPHRLVDRRRPNRSRQRRRPLRPPPPTHPPQRLESPTRTRPTTRIHTATTHRPDTAATPKPLPPTKISRLSHATRHSLRPPGSTHPHHSAVRITAPTGLARGTEP